jgi:cytochrome c oxidase assembly protein subunit 11
MTPLGKSNRSSDLRVAAMAAAVALGMVGLSYASVPLYRLFCQVTGYGGTTKRADAAPAQISNRMFTVRFDSNIASSLPWTFKPAQLELNVRAGEQVMAHYRAKNTSDRTLTGTAVFNVTPDEAGQYFNKIQCFCFSEQTLKPGETADFPVIFFVDPNIDQDPNAKSIKTITLSYTFYPANTPAEPQATN